VENLPLLTLDEKSWVEKLVGRPLSNDEAQELIHNATLEAAFERWMLSRKGAA
jgi:hypothetical protein